jgi:sulfur-oxidizing protein SoxB
MDRRGFLSTLSVAAAGGLPLRAAMAADHGPDERLYDIADPPGNSISLLHFTDCHAQLNPVWFREPSVNLGTGAQQGRVPHRVGAALLQDAGIRPNSATGYALSCLDFGEAARRFGKVGGFAHLATLVKRLRASRPAALLLDGGDSWQGSALALWSEGRDMIAASRELGVDAMTGHWEFTLGAARVRTIVDSELGGIEFLAHNVSTREFGDPVFTPWILREQHGVAVAIIGQAFPYTPVAHPGRLVPEWTFGLQEAALQRHIDAARRAGAQVVVLLSHNGMDVDLKLASRVLGLDAILGGHTHDGVAHPVVVANPSGTTLVSNAGSNGKFLGVLDLQVREGKVRGHQYHLLPVFAQALPADPAMQTLITRLRAPYAERLAEPLARTEGLLYRRGNFNGTYDQLIVQALMEVCGAEIAFSPGFRWGTSLLPGEMLTRELLMDQTAITYPQTTLRDLSGAAIKDMLEDVCDNLFNNDPYYQQGGDMVRVGGLRYTCTPAAALGRRISDLRLGDTPLHADRKYRVASWASVADTAKDSGAPIWEVVEEWLRHHRNIPVLQPNVPRLVGTEGDPGLSPG